VVCHNCLDQDIGVKSNTRYWGSCFLTQKDIEKELDLVLESIVEKLYEEGHRALSDLYSKDLLNDLFTVEVSTTDKEVQISMDIGAEVLILSDLSPEKAIMKAFERAIEATEPLIMRAKQLLQSVGNRS